ncbi:WXG100-like domain-containing protein [Streptomyces griseosporeus]|uniref:WXG100-like domain-containing protein n=1 Tax=Streptomyces griseosporeus TaxID=1910 RepID=UPI0036F55C49
MSVVDKAREVVEDLTGLWWPDADEDGLRDAAKAWRAFADDVDDVTVAANKAARTLIEHNKGEAISAFDDPFWRRYYYDGRGWLKDLADAARAMAKALDAYADAVHDAKKKIEHQLEIAAVSLGVGTALAVFTFGLSEGAALGAAAVVTELAAGLGVAVTEEVAAIAGTTLAAAAFAGVESVTVDLAVTQPLSIALGEQKGLSLDEASRAATDGMLYGGMFGAAAGTTRTVVGGGGFGAVFGDSFGLSSAAVDQMGKERYWKLLRSEDSKVPVPPKKPGDFELISGDPVYYGRSTTTIGYDERTLNNLQRVARMPGVHDVVVHGTNKGVFLPGRINTAGRTLTDFEVHPNHIVDAIRHNPNYNGGPVRLISCHSGADARPPELPLAQTVANELGVPVYAPTNKVGTSAELGLNQAPTIGDNGYWRIYLPVTH